MYAESDMAAPAATVQNALQEDLRTPEDILVGLRLLRFVHWSFAGQEKRGSIVMHKIAMPATRAYFRLAYKLKFPIHSAYPINRYGWSDEKSLACNNSCGHNMRRIDDGTGRWSLHAIGCAKDTNPMQNPCLIFDETGQEVKRQPTLGVYDKSFPGTLTLDHPLVKVMEDHGFVWGGTWTTLKDYQHFQMDRAILPEYLARYVN